MAKTVVGFFDEAEDAQKAMQRLQQVGISQNSIDFTSGGAGAYSSTSTNVSTNDRQEEGNAITRFFNSLFGDDSDDARKYSRVGSNSNYIITVHASSADEAEQAADIMDDCGAIDVDERASGEGSYNDYNNMSSSTDRDSDYDRRSGDSINRMEEELRVGKREVETGRVHVRSRIIETPVEEHVRLRQEHVNIERNPVDRRVSGDEIGNFEDRDFEVTEHAEVPVIDKEARIVEEIRINKEVDEKDEVIRDTVRKTDVDIDEDRDSKRRIDPDDRSRF
jgi:stress response protein YsnF